MRKAAIMLLAVLMAVCLPAFAEEANLVRNPGFESTFDNVLPDDWTYDMWDATGGFSYLEITEDGFEGNGVMIKNVVSNDARFCQQIEVEPDTLYEFRCMAKASGVTAEGKGANISVLGTFSYSNMVYETHGDWVELVLYGRTGPDQRGLTLCLRLGGYSGTNIGTAWFDSVTVRKVDSVPAGYFEQDLSPMTYSATPVKEDTADEVPPRYTETWLLASFGIALGITAVYRKHRRLPDDRRKNLLILAGILVAALVIRIFIAYSVFGYHTDINCFSGWGERMLSKGPLDFYSPDQFCDYPPLYMFLLGGIAALRNALGIAYQSAAHVLLIKLIPILFDIALAVFVYAFADKRAGRRIALMLAVICALNPAAIVDSAAWGQIDSVFVFMTVVAAMMLCERKYHIALPLIVLAIFTKPQTLLFGPLGLFAIIFNIVYDAVKSRGSDSAEVMRGILRALIGVGVSVAMVVAVALIFHFDGVNPLVWLYDLYFNTLNGYSYLTINAFNLYELLGFNWVKLAVVPTLADVSWILFALAYAYSFVVYGFARRRGALYISAAALIMLICAFGPMIHERYVYPAIVLLLLAYAEEKDWRLILSLGVISITLFMNQTLVLQGGMTRANYGHLQSSEAWVNAFMSALTVLNALFIAVTTFDICVLGHRMTYRGKQKEQLFDAPAVRPERYRLNLRRRDYIIMAGVTLAYSVLAFTNLGTLNAPETQFTFSEAGESVVFDLGEERTWRMEYYGGICNTTFTVELSGDGESWTAPVTAEYDQGEIFRWKYFAPCGDDLKPLRNQLPNTAADGTALAYADTEKYPFQTARYVRISAKTAGLVLTEIGFIDAEANVLPVMIAGHTGYAESHGSDPLLLIDEQSSVPEAPSYLNSTYFDEIYHARTAYEHQNGLNTYEWTHPPLGKVLIMLGIEIFGMNPFGWRFMGALMGVLMLPVIYLMAKQLGGSTGVSTLAMLLMALDSMHFTQTRIATIDSFAVFWIMLMYLFMIRYTKMNFNIQPLWKTLVPLALCGVTMGIAWATKWIGIYASAGLAVLFFWSFIRRYAEHRALLNAVSGEERSREISRYWRCALMTTAVCIVCFILIPVLIYYCSYYWHLEAEFGFSFSRQCIDRVIQIQQNIFNYHSGLGGDTHYFRSPWYQWPVIAWPMWYYSGTDYVAKGMVSSISCMGNPAVWWTGLCAMLFMLVRCAWKKRRPDKASLIIIVGFLSQYLPWVLVPRSTFIYHYFASVPFIILATAFMLGMLEKRSKVAFRITAGSLVFAALALFIMFYPLESGLPMRVEYARTLSWFDWYNSTASALRR